MSDKRKPEDTVCPLIYAALLADLVTEEAEQKASCLGEKCQMFDTFNAKCGLRFR